jgi:transcription termination factor Rho
VTDTLEPAADAAPSTPRKRSGGLNAMLLADLKAMAAGMGITGAGAMKKAQLVDAIKAAQAGGAPPAEREQRTRTRTPEREAPARAGTDPEQDRKQRSEPTTPEQSAAPKQDTDAKRDAGPKQDPPKQDPPKQDASKQDASKQDASKQDARKQDGKQNPQQEKQDKQAPKNQPEKGPGAGPKDQGGQKGQGGQGNQGQGNQGNQGQGNQGQANQGQANQGQGNQADQDDEEGRGGRNRRRRGRDRTRTAGTQPGASQRNEPDTTVLEDDVLVPAAGILDVLDNYAFVRTSGYLPGADDVYLSLSMVRKFGLRRGDAIVGQVRQPREGERKEKFNPMVRIDSVNGGDAQQAGSRPVFDDLTPVDPTERLRMETGADDLVGRALDLLAPVGKGQRGLVVAPPKSGATRVLQAVAAAVTANNPECHLMVVLVDSRPEEVTAFQRSVKGEVIASTFDRPPGDHTIVAELAIERAKRLVELGHDVVLLLDGITRLGRAYNLSVAASGRILPGGVDVAALHPPKRFFGAARNVENGGSLTLVATALAESGSRTDEVILEELAGADNMELRLLRDPLAGRLPAIDAAASGTRREDLLMSAEEQAVVGRLRAELTEAGRGASSRLQDRLTGSASNIELLTRLQRGSGHGGGR